MVTLGTTGSEYRYRQWLPVYPGSGYRYLPAVVAGGPRQSLPPNYAGNQCTYQGKNHARAPKSRGREKIMIERGLADLLAGRVPRLSVARRGRC
jgi:sRNA-binding protein